MSVVLAPAASHPTNIAAHETAFFVGLLAVALLLLTLAATPRGFVRYRPGRFIAVHQADLAVFGIVILFAVAGLYLWLHLMSAGG